MNERILTPEHEPTTDDIISANREAFERARLDVSLAHIIDDLMITPDDEVTLYRNEGGSAVDSNSAWENTVGWWMQLGLDPTDYFDEDFVEKLGVG